MGAFLLKTLQDVRANYWFVPACMLIISLVLAGATTAIDLKIASVANSLPVWMSATQPDGARTILSVLASSTIGVAGVTFSITIVAVSFASANYGPRLIGNFMRDRASQATLGIFIGTFVYCLAVLRTVHASASETQLVFVPHISIAVALFLALACVGALIFYIHHIPETINVEKIAASIGRQIQQAFDHPYRGPETGEDDAGGAIADRWSARNTINPGRVCAQGHGYIQAIDLDTVRKEARASDLLIEIVAQPGQFLTEDDTVLRFWPAANAPEIDTRTLQGAFALGEKRTPYQNVTYLFDQLVEIIARALSPGVNDPYTAVTCIDWIRASFEAAMRDERSDQTRDAAARVRVHAPDLQSLMDDVLTKVQPYAKGDHIAAAALSRCLNELRRKATDERIAAHLTRLQFAFEDRGETGADRPSLTG